MSSTLSLPLSSSTRLSTRSRKAAVVTVTSSERTITTSFRASRSGNRSSIRSSACFDSGLLVTSPSLESADPSNPEMRAKPTRTITPHTIKTRRGRATAIAASRRGLRREARTYGLLGSLLVGARCHVEAEHHAAFVVLGDMAVRHPKAGVGDVEQDVDRLPGQHQHRVLPDQAGLDEPVAA